MKTKKTIAICIAFIMVLSVFTGCSGKTNTNGTYAKQAASSTVVTTKFTCSGTYVGTNHNKIAFDVSKGRNFSVNQSESDLYLYLNGYGYCKVYLNGTKCVKSTTGDFKAGDTITISSAKMNVAGSLQSCTVYVKYTSLSQGVYYATVTYE